MNLVRIIEWLRQRLTTVVRVCLVGLAVLVLVDAIPGVVDKEHAHTALERWPGFWALFGFLGCVVLILVSKWFGHCGIMKDEDYYDD
jgi:succinate dehydrogenase hydrophobic anchor subunit